MPNNLVCNASDCGSNSGGLCHANKIHIKGVGARNASQTLCATYSTDSFSSSVRNIFNTNYSGIVGQDIFDGAPAHPKVSCSANTCAHNAYGECDRNSLQIFSEREGETDCASFEAEF
ncbi:MAG: DUF1540 domain-containing protein [Sarcina sp.]